MVIACDTIEQFQIIENSFQYRPFTEVFAQFSLIEAGLNYSAKKAYDLPQNAVNSNRVVGIHQALGHHCYTIEFFDAGHTTLLFRKNSWFDKPWKRYDSIVALIKRQNWLLFDMS
ncbi:hypothetical protein [Herpetosiphon sp. NSE202]|uniref:hypothetical protein n=1 Tax=Herpetosiphon sp. NSE202 TaxID=3351349 RepID=UPI003631BAD1